MAPKATDDQVTAPVPAEASEGEPAPDGAATPDQAATPDPDAEFKRLSRHSADAIEQTVLRPSVAGVAQVPDAASQPIDDTEEHFVVRNTRDYDHDAQSEHLASPAGRFETISEAESSREIRRDPYARSARKGSVPGEGNSRGRTRPILAMLLVALLLGGGGAILTYGMELWGGKEVPLLVGESQNNAESRLADKGLVARVETELSDEAVGKVLAQEPDSGTRVPEGSEVTIRVAAARVVPELLGLMEDEARARLEELGATNITTVEKPSTELDGTVIAVSPEVGRTFASGDEIVITIAGWYHVPDVVGKRETDAVRVIEEMGLATKVTYVSSSEEVRTVVETVPAPGEPVHSSAAVELKVSSPYPSDTTHLAEYFAHSSQDVDAFLLKEDFTFGKGFLDSHGNALQTYTSKDKGDITFSSQPYTSSLALPKDGSANVMATGAPIAGVRLVLPSSLVPDKTDETTLEELAKDFGFEGKTDYCDAKTSVLPSGTSRTKTEFGCIAGKQDDLIWTIAVVGSGKSARAVATCGREGLYPASSLSAYGGKVSDFVAYQEVYATQAATSSSSSSKDSKGTGASTGSGNNANGAASSNSSSNAG